MRSDLADLLASKGQYSHMLRSYPDVFGYFDRLTGRQRTVALAMLSYYLSHDRSRQVHKLLKHAIRYAAERQLTLAGYQQWVVKGDHGERHVAIWPDSCYCDMFRGEPPFTDEDKGDCSHVMAAHILAALWVSPDDI
jgi:hypothetical protein